MRLVLLGPPGVGKGTQAARIAERLGIPHISTGELFRRAVTDGSALGAEVKRFLDTGGLVPDELTTRVLRERLQAPDAAAGFVLDGYPRTLGQAKALERLLAERGQTIDAAVSYEAPDEVVVERLSGRRMCRQCGANFHVKFDPPAKDGVCDRCGGALYQRSDDAPETIRERLRVYRRATAPLVEHYRRAGRLVTVSAVEAPDEVERKTRCALEAAGPAAEGAPAAGTTE